MSYFARLWGRDSRRRPVPARYVLEALEGRTMLSGTGATTAASISSQTTIYTNFPTVVAGAQVAFLGVVQNASTGAPITSGNVTFVAESPNKIVLGEASVNSQGQATIVTSDLTTIGSYQIEAQYTPSNSSVSASVSSPETTNVIPLPLDVPTATTVVSGAASAEAGQSVPLLATVHDAGTGDQVNAGKVEPISGTVEFVEDSPQPVVLGKVTLNKNAQAALSTNMLKNVGPYQIEADFVSANNYFAGSNSARTAMTITPTTVNAPTVTSLTAVTPSVETGEPMTFSASVQNTNSSLADGVVEFVTVGRHPVVLGKVDVGTFGQQLSLTTSKLEKVGTYQIEAKYLPNTNRFAESASPPVNVTVTPLRPASFRVTPTLRRAHINVPLSFTVTAVDAQKQPVTNYTGTVLLSSPTDSWTTFPTAVYRSLKTPAPSPLTQGLATFTTQSYTFTLADHGSHTFVGAVTFGKGGAEILQVTQANNHEVRGKATFAIS
ncbi:MAG TPA: Ig-like domain repeat protein [Isosphaeraceae bacterium]|nr:Ig-like domain repeat protein [Isosphaeraceae bacterium]